MDSSTSLIKKGYESISGNWLLTVAAVIVYSIITSAFSNTLDGWGSLFSLFLGGAMSVGLSYFFLNLIRKKELRIEHIFEGFKNYISTLVAGILLAVAVGIGIVLLIVPGIIVALGLSQTFYILADNPEMDGLAALKKSWELMDGHKTDYFVLVLLFILMLIGGILAFIVGVFFVLPIIYATSAHFYEQIKEPAKGTLVS